MGVSIARSAIRNLFIFIKKLRSIFLGVHQARNIKPINSFSYEILNRVFDWSLAEIDSKWTVVVRDAMSINDSNGKDESQKRSN
jgi:hypothetical protein